MTGSVVDSVIAGVAVFLLLHIVIWRVKPSNSPRMLLLGLLATIGVAMSLLVNVWMKGLNGFELCAVLWIDVFVIIFYVFVYAGVARSVSVTLLSRLLHSGTQSVDFKTLVEEYTVSTRFEERLHLMYQSGLIQLTENRATLTRNGLRLACWAKRLGQVIGDGLQG